MEWLRLEKEERPSLVGLYFDYPDKIAQDHGVFSKEVGPEGFSGINIMRENEYI